MIDPEEAEHLALWVPQPILCGLRRRAALMGISEVALAEMLLKTTVEDDLYEAVLGGRGPRRAVAVGVVNDAGRTAVGQG
jgi:hypothetical protein